MIAPSKRGSLSLELTDDDAHLQDGTENERSLWAAVLLQLLLDATKPKKDRETNETRVLRSKAISFFRASVGTTAESYADVCHLAGFNPERFREQAFSVINSGNPIIRKRISSILSGQMDETGSDDNG
jgi:hypothetical protein